jgi:hypothetical protein
MPLLRPQFINSLEILLMSQRAEKLTIAQRSILTGSNSLCGCLKEKNESSAQMFQVNVFSSK